MSRTHTIMLLAAGLTVAILSSGAEAQPPAAVAFRGATLIDGTGRPPLPSSTIIVSGERIAAVGPESLVAIPSGASVIEGR